MAGMTRRAPDGSMMVIFTIFSKTDGGPLECEAVDVATVGVDAMALTDGGTNLLAVGMTERAVRRAEAVNIALGGWCCLLCLIW